MVPLPSSVPTTNLILYGPPGTGKTFTTAAEAVRLCDEVPPEPAAVRLRYEALVKAGQVRFVTFHQSFSYEEFVEGLRPVTGEDGGDGPGFRLEPKNGIFRDLASEATQAYEAAKRNEGSIGYDLSNRRFWKFALGNSTTENDVFQGAMQGDYVVLGWGYDVDWSASRFEDIKAMEKEWALRYPEDKKPSQTQQPWLLRNQMKPGDIVIVPAGNTRFRAVGEITGPYEFKLGPDGEYSQRRAVKWLVRPEAPLALADIVDGDFTMRALYEISPKRIKTEALARLIKAPVSTPVRPDQFVLIIDEINRGNISKVFGELLTLLEPDKRLDAENQVSVRLPYSGEPFTVPPNLHVIGTMNTADRSIALLDTALRRRFEFRELMPDPGMLALVDGIDLPVVLRTLNDRIEYLFDREHQIGHAFFMGCQNRADIDAVMRHKVIPLLAEYFFEDWSKVAAVLGGEEGNGFLDHKQLTPPKGFEDEGTTRIRWSVKAEFDYGQLL